MHQHRQSSRLVSIIICSGRSLGSPSLCVSFIPTAQEVTSLGQPVLEHAGPSVSVVLNAVVAAQPICLVQPDLRPNGIPWVHMLGPA